MIRAIAGAMVTNGEGGRIVNIASNGLRVWIGVEPGPLHDDNY
jgi:hypothetical protein